MGKTVAIVMTEVFLRRLTPALMPFARRQQDFRIVSIRRPVGELQRLIRELQPRGLITEWLPEVTDRLLKLKLPTVVADTDLSYPGVVSIDVDDWEVGAEAARAFRQAGFRNLACLGNGLPYSDQRIEGFCREAGPEVAIYSERGLDDARYSEHFGSPDPNLLEWLQALPKPVGIFAVHDPLGRFLCGACQRLELPVPETVSLIGANNDELVCGLTYPMLSSVSIPWDRIGATVGETMHQLLSGHPVPRESIRIPPSGVILRHSANHLAVEDPNLRRAMSFLSERLQDPISIGQLCDELHLSRRGLERSFRDFYQCTPWEMLSRMRVRRAKQLLVDTNHPVSVISELSGFNDPERMAVVFKRVVGVPPSSFRSRGFRSGGRGGSPRQR